MTVSHDRYFLDRICDGLFILQNQHLKYVNGGYSQNLDTTTKEEKEKGQGALAYKQSKQKKIKMTYMEKKEFEEIEDVIMDLETNLSQIEEKMNGVTDFSHLFIAELEKAKIDEKPYVKFTGGTDGSEKQLGGIYYFGEDGTDAGTGVVPVIYKAGSVDTFLYGATELKNDGGTTTVSYTHLTLPTT